MVGEQLISQNYLIDQKFGIIKVVTFLFLFLITVVWLLIFFGGETLKDWFDQ